MEACDEVRVLLILNDLLKFESEPTCGEWMRGAYGKGNDVIHSLFRHFGFVRVNDILFVTIYRIRAKSLKQSVRTFMMTTSVDWKSEGLDAGSNTDELDWKDWKRPLISRLRAKLLRNRTYDFGENDSS